MRAEEIKTIWKTIKPRLEDLESQIIWTHIGFMREVAMCHLERGDSVFFQPNTVVHWGERGFGRLTIVTGEDVLSDICLPGINIYGKDEAKIIGGFCQKVCKKHLGGHPFRCL
jgi:hypothetical protein